MDILTLDTNLKSKKAKDAHSEFNEYLTRTRNTICGRHPIGVLLGALAGMQEGTQSIDDGEIYPTLRWVRYAQSGACQTIRDSSVSYASAYVVI